MSVIALKRWHPDKIIEIWGQDEARVGLQPIIRKMWSPKGIRPVGEQCRRYQWLYAYTFVHPQNGDSFWLLMPSVNTVIMNITLKEFAEYCNPNNDKIIILLVDGAGWHTSQELAIPENIRLFPLPPHTPELQPTESVWPLLKEGVANRSFINLDELEATMIPRCQWLIDNPIVVKGAVGFNWIQKIENRTV